MLAFAPENGPALALIPSVMLPIGDDDFAGDDATLLLHGVASFPLPERFGLTTVAGVNRSTADDTSIAGALIAVLGQALGATTGAYVEFGWYPTPDSADPVYGGGGATWLLSDRVQLDASVDRGLNDVAKRWLFGTGLSMLF